MKNHNLLKGGWLALALLAGVYGMPAFAAKDAIYPSATIATVNVTSVAVANNFTMGADGHTTLDSSVNAGDMILVTARWSIQDKHGSGTNTEYIVGGRTVNFTVSYPSINPAPVSATLTGTSCTGITSAGADKCETVISFAAPTTVGSYQLQVMATDPATPANTRIEGAILSINFSVTEQTEPAKKETKLTVDPKCVLFNSDVDLTATLEELDDGAKIGNANLYFSIDESPIGLATTNSSGIATRPFNVSGLGVGDYTLSAEFAGDDDYKESNDSATLGITYLFMGFGQPINGDGTSIFGGRVIPIKIGVVDANGYPVTDATPTVWLTSYDTLQGVGEELKQVSSVSAADTGNFMRYVPEEKRYIYNWDARELGNGTYAVVVDLGDSRTCRAEHPYAIITVAKKGGKN